MVLLCAVCASAAERSKKGSASAGSSAPAAKAFTPSPEFDESFRRADLNGDGMVSLSEAAGNERLVTGFDRADRNHDGKLSRQEYEALMRAKPRSTARAAAP